MRYPRKKYAIILFLFVLLIGCNGQEWPQEKGKLVLHHQFQHRLGKTLGKNLRMDHPSFIIYDGNGLLYISDTNHHQIVVIDRTGKEIKRIGKMGRGPLEFLYPTGITLDEAQNLYVVDSGNKRIQVINEQGNMVRQIKIKDIPLDAMGGRFWDIAVKDRDLYLSVQTMDPKSAKIYHIASNGEIRGFGGGLVGKIENLYGEIRFVSEGEFKEMEGGTSFESGRNYMVEVGRSGLGKVVELPYQYTPGEIIGDDKELLVLSRAYGSIDRFDQEGNYIYTTYRFKLPVDEMRGLTGMAYDGKSIYVLNSNHALIYVLEKDHE